MASSEGGQKSLPLILARELAANVATPLMVVDPVGTIVYYNEAAERLLGQSFATAGELPADRWRTIVAPTAADGSEIDYEDLPLVVALTSRQPSHGALMITGFDGLKHRIEATCFPLLGAGEKLVGGVALFWEDGG